MLTLASPSTRLELRKSYLRVQMVLVASENKADFVQVVPIELSSIDQAVKSFFGLHIYYFFWLGTFSKYIGPKHWPCCFTEAPACKEAVITL